MKTSFCLKNFISKRLLITSFLIASLSTFLFAGDDFYGHYEKNLSLNNTGMTVLGSWAIANIAIGAYGWVNNSGERMYFQQMNLFWNVVNLSIAGIALYGNYTQDYLSLSHNDLVLKMLKTEKILLINAALDVGYMTAGVLMRHYASGSEQRRNLLKGYGSSVILQGAFLFVFDLILYSTLKSHRLSFANGLSMSYIPEIKGVALNFQF